MRRGGVLNHPEGGYFATVINSLVHSFDSYTATYYINQQFHTKYQLKMDLIPLK